MLLLFLSQILTEWHLLQGDARVQFTEYANTVVKNPADGGTMSPTDHPQDGHTLYPKDLLSRRPRQRYYFVFIRVREPTFFLLFTSLVVILLSQGLYDS